MATKRSIDQQMFDPSNPNTMMRGDQLYTWVQDPEIMALAEELEITPEEAAVQMGYAPGKLDDPATGAGSWRPATYEHQGGQLGKVLGTFLAAGAGGGLAAGLPGILGAGAAAGGASGAAGAATASGLPLTSALPAGFGATMAGPGSALAAGAAGIGGAGAAGAGGAASSAAKGGGLMSKIGGILGSTPGLMGMSALMGLLQGGEEGDAPRRSFEDVDSGDPRKKVVSPIQSAYEDRTSSNEVLRALANRQPFQQQAPMAPPVQGLGQMPGSVSKRSPAQGAPDFSKLFQFLTDRPGAV